MSIQKHSDLQVEEDAEKGHSHKQSPVEADKEIYHEDGAILADVAGTHKGDQAAVLKTAKDGHVSRLGLPVSYPSVLFDV